MARLQKATFRSVLAAAVKLLRVAVPAAGLGFRVGQIEREVADSVRFKPFWRRRVPAGGYWHFG